MVLLNTFPISIMNHLLLIIPVQPGGGGGLLSYSAMGCVSASVRNAAVCVSMRATSAQSTKPGDG